MKVEKRFYGRKGSLNGGVIDKVQEDSSERIFGALRGLYNKGAVVRNPNSSWIYS